MERLYRLGYAYTREERKSAYHDLFERGKQMAQSLMDMLHRPQTT
jgi:IS1 family transposase